MTVQTRKSSAQFKSLKINVMNAIFAVSDRELEARLAGDEELGDKLFEERSRLQDEAVQVRMAEIAYLNSEKEISEAETILTNATKDIKNALTGLSKINTALQAAAQFFTLLKRLSNLFN